MATTKNEAKRAVEILRSKHPTVGPYTFAKRVTGGGSIWFPDPVDEQLSDVAFAGYANLYSILSVIRRYDAKQTKQAQRTVGA